MSNVTIYTDGACRGNPGPGAWAAILESGKREREITGVELDTTNNRMELMAAIAALELLRKRCRVTLYTDSSYLQRGVTEWLEGWIRRGWKTSGRKPVKNRDLWERLDAVRGKHDISWRWVRGHAGHDGNERADELANVALDELESRGFELE